MRHGDADATEIKNKGWRQGSVLPDALAQRLIGQGVLSRSEWPQKLVVASHDCDVTNRSFEAEPTVELLCAAVLGVSEKDGRYFWGKNPRHYQVERKLAGDRSIWQFSIQDRVWLPRQRLLDSEPDAALALPSDDMRRVALWLARRYRRPAFPDTFVERTREATAKIRKPLKSQGDLLTAVFLFGVDEELPSETPYEIIMYGSMRAEDWSDPNARACAQTLLDEIEGAFGESHGVDVRECLLRSEADISLDDIRLLKRWNFDDLTIRGQEPSDLPPED